MISATAVLTAVCGYQAGKWSGEQAKLYNEASAYRVTASEAQAKSNDLRMIDIGLFVRYIEALHTGDKAEADFFAARIRPEARPALRAWIATKPLKSPGAPSSPFVMKEYRLASDAEANRDDRLASELFKSAQEATRNSDDFLMLTVIFASVSFMAGISTKLVFPSHLIVVGIGFIALLYGIVRLSTLPFR